MTKGEPNGVATETFHTTHLPGPASDCFLLLRLPVPAYQRHGAGSVTAGVGNDANSLTAL